MSRFTDTLIVSPFPDGKTWGIRSDFGYDVGEEGSGESINVPRGFVTDFASVPRPLWVIFPRWGKYGNAAVVHDYLYWHQKYSRERADDIFLEAMGVLGVSQFEKYSLYYAVKLFGCCAWRSNKKSKIENPKFNKDKADSLIGKIYMINYGKNENWAYHSNIECVVFTVVEDGQPITCKVSMEAIEDHYGNCDEQEILDKAKEHFDEITDQIGDKIGRKRFEEDGTILLSSGDW